MYYMQRITWSGVAMHQGIVPNYPASHGCIRLPEAFAKQLWGITKLGVRVIVARGEVTPVAISHARLFTLKSEPLEPKIDVKFDSKVEPVVTSAERVKAAYGALEVAQLTGKKRDVAARDITASDASKLADPALDAIAYALKNPRETPATSSEVVRSAYNSFEAPKVRRAKSLASNAVAEIKPLKPGPISVFISRKEGKLFVRKGFEPVFDAPVTFEQPDKPLGTHVFTALGAQGRQFDPALEGGVDAGRRIGGQEVGEGRAGIHRPGIERERSARSRYHPAGCDRADSELMSPGASLIISDQGLGPGDRHRHRLRRADALMNGLQLSRRLRHARPFWPGIDVSSLRAQFRASAASPSCGR